MCNFCSFCAKSAAILALVKAFLPLQKAIRTSLMIKRLTTLLLIVYLLSASVSLSAQQTGPLIGTCTSGTASGGVLFSYSTVTGKDSILTIFTYPNGYSPEGNVIQASDGLLYGMTYQGGTYGVGVLFSFNLATGKDSTLVNFDTINGALPTGSLVQTSNGLLYGMTLHGGTHNKGVIFCFNRFTGKDSILLNFNDTNGGMPYGNLIQATNGLLYGLTYVGGSNGNGVLFSYNPLTGFDTVLLSFTGANGNNPQGSLIQAFDGNLYGLTAGGGSAGQGVLFQYNPATYKDTVLLNFNGANGAGPSGSLVQATDSNFYGITGNGGSNSAGVLFRFNHVTGKDTVLINLDATIGESPKGSLIQATNGMLYGMGLLGGAYSKGTLFGYNISMGADTVLWNFSDTLGDYPYADVYEAMSGNIFQTAAISCFGDSNAALKVSAQGARLPVTYLWNTGSTSDSIGGLKAGVYNCTITDARGISLTFYATIKQPSQILPNATVTNVCSGGAYGTIALNTTGGTGPYTFLWNNKDTTSSIDSLKPGHDTCVITDSHGCSTKFIDSIQQGQPLKIDSIVSSKTGCPACSNGTVTVYVSGGIPPGDSAYYIYNWGIGVDSATVHGLDTGMYRVCVYSPYGCSQGGICDSVQVLAGINPIAELQHSILIYPVPSKGNISVTLKGLGYQRMIITDELGKEIYATNLNEGLLIQRIPINLQGNPAGIYVAQFITQSGTTVKKIVLE